MFIAAAFFLIQFFVLDLLCYFNDKYRHYNLWQYYNKWKKETERERALYVLHHLIIIFYVIIIDLFLSHSLFNHCFVLYFTFCSIQCLSFEFHLYAMPCHVFFSSYKWLSINNVHELVVFILFSICILNMYAKFYCRHIFSGYAVYKLAHSWHIFRERFILVCAICYYKKKLYTIEI